MQFCLVSLSPEHGKHPTWSPWGPVEPAWLQGNPPHGLFRCNICFTVTPVCSQYLTRPLPRTESLSSTPWSLLCSSLPLVLGTKRNDVTRGEVGGGLLDSFLCFLLTPFTFSPCCFFAFLNQLDLPNNFFSRHPSFPTLAGLLMKPPVLAAWSLMCS